jgi:hypothetical protein
MPEQGVETGDLQCFRAQPIAEDRLSFVRASVEPLDEPDTNEKDITLSEHNALLLCTRFEVGNADGVRRPRVVRQSVARGGVVVDEVKEHTTPTDTVV